MAQDFAKKRTPPQGNRQAVRSGQGSAPVSRMNWFISGFLLGVISVVGGYLGLMEYQKLHPDALKTVDDASIPQKQPDFDFGFYRELAKKEVAVPSEQPDPAATPPSSPANTATAAPPQVTATAEANQSFMLQAGSFQDKQEADERRAKVMLLNMPAEILPGVVAGRTWYRVQVGPFSGRTAADDARKQLSANNIDSIPLLMR